MSSSVGSGLRPRKKVPIQTLSSPAAASADIERAGMIRMRTPPPMNANMQKDPHNITLATARARAAVRQVSVTSAGDREPTLGGVNDDATAVMSGAAHAHHYSSSIKGLAEPHPVPADQLSIRGDLFLVSPMHPSTRKAQHDLLSACSGESITANNGASSDTTGPKPNWVVCDEGHISVYTSFSHQAHLIEEVQFDRMTLLFNFSAAASVGSQILPLMSLRGGLGGKSNPMAGYHRAESVAITAKSGSKSQAQHQGWATRSQGRATTTSTTLQHHSIASRVERDVYSRTQSSPAHLHGELSSAASSHGINAHPPLSHPMVTHHYFGVDLMQTVPTVGLDGTPTAAALQHRLLIFSTTSTEDYMEWLGFFDALSSQSNARHQSSMALRRCSDSQQKQAASPDPVSRLPEVETTETDVDGNAVGTRRYNPWGLKYVGEDDIQSGFALDATKQFVQQLPEQAALEPLEDQTELRTALDKANYWADEHKKLLVQCTAQLLEHESLFREMIEDAQDAARSLASSVASMRELDLTIAASSTGRYWKNSLGLLTPSPGTTPRTGCLMSPSLLLLRSPEAAANRSRTSLPPAPPLNIDDEEPTMLAAQESTSSSIGLVDAHANRLDFLREQLVHFAQEHDSATLTLYQSLQLRREEMEVLVNENATLKSQLQSLRTDVLSMIDENAAHSSSPSIPVDVVQADTTAALSVLDRYPPQLRAPRSSYDRLLSMSHLLTCIARVVVTRTSVATPRRPHRRHRRRQFTRTTDVEGAVIVPHAKDVATDETMATSDHDSDAQPPLSDVPIAPWEVASTDRMGSSTPGVPTDGAQLLDDEEDAAATTLDEDSTVEDAAIGAAAASVSSVDDVSATHSDSEAAQSDVLMAYVAGDDRQDSDDGQDLDQDLNVEPLGEIDDSVSVTSESAASQGYEDDDANIAGLLDRFHSRTVDLVTNLQQVEAERDALIRQVDDLHRKLGEHEVELRCVRDELQVAFATARQQWREALQAETARSESKAVMAEEQSTRSRWMEEYWLVSTEMVKDAFEWIQTHQNHRIQRLEAAITIQAEHAAHQDALIERLENALSHIEEDAVLNATHNSVALESMTFDSSEHHDDHHDEDFHREVGMADHAVVTIEPSRSSISTSEERVGPRCDSAFPPMMTSDQADIMTTTPRPVAQETADGTKGFAESCVLATSTAYDDAKDSRQQFSFLDTTHHEFDTSLRVDAEDGSPLPPPEDTSMGGVGNDAALLRSPVEPLSASHRSGHGHHWRTSSHRKPLRGTSSAALKSAPVMNTARTPVPAASSVLNPALHAFKSPRATARRRFMRALHSLTAAALATSTPVGDASPSPTPFDAPVVHKLHVDVPTVSPAEVLTEEAEPAVTVVEQPRREVADASTDADEVSPAAVNDATVTLVKSEPCVQEDSGHPSSTIQENQEANSPARTTSAAQGIDVTSTTPPPSSSVVAVPLAVVAGADESAPINPAQQNTLSAINRASTKMGHAFHELEEATSLQAERAQSRVRTLQDTIQNERQSNAMLLRILNAVLQQWHHNESLIQQRLSVLDVALSASPVPGCSPLTFVATGADAILDRFRPSNNLKPHHEKLVRELCSQYSQMQELTDALERTLNVAERELDTQQIKRKREIQELRRAKEAVESEMRKTLRSADEEKQRIENALSQVNKLREEEEEEYRRRTEAAAERARLEGIEIERRRLQRESEEKEAMLEAERERLAREKEEAISALNAFAESRLKEQEKEHSDEMKRSNEAMHRKLIEEAEAASQKLADKDDELRKHVEQLTAQVQERELAHGQAAARCEELDRELSKSRSSQNSLQETISALNQDLEVAKKRAEEEEAQRIKTMQELHAKHEAMESNVRLLESKNESEAQSLKSKIRLIKQERDSLETQNSELKKQLRDLEDELTLAAKKREEEYLELKMKKEKQLFELQCSVTQMSEHRKRDAEELQRKLDEVDAARRAKEEEASQLERHATTLERKVSQLSDIVKEREAIVRNVGEELEGIRQDRGSLKRTVSDLNMELMELSKRNEESEKRRQAELQRLQEQHSTTVKQMEQTWIDDEERKSADAENLRVRVRDLVGDRNAKEKRVTELEGVIKGLENSMALLKDHNEHLEQTVLRLQSFSDEERSMQEQRSKLGIGEVEQWRRRYMATLVSRDESLVMGRHLGEHLLQLRCVAEDVTSSLATPLTDTSKPFLSAASSLTTAPDGTDSVIDSPSVEDASTNVEVLRAAGDANFDKTLDWIRKSKGRSAQDRKTISRMQQELADVTKSKIELQGQLQSTELALDALRLEASQQQVTHKQLATQQENVAQSLRARLLDTETQVADQRHAIQQLESTIHTQRAEHDNTIRTVQNRLVQQEESLNYSNARLAQVSEETKWCRQNMDAAFERSLQSVLATETSLRSQLEDQERMCFAHVWAHADNERWSQCMCSHAISVWSSALFELAEPLMKSHLDLQQHYHNSVEEALLLLGDEAPMQSDSLTTEESRVSESETGVMIDKLLGACFRRRQTIKELNTLVNSTSMHVEEDTVHVHLDDSAGSPTIRVPDLVVHDGPRDEPSSTKTTTPHSSPLKLPTATATTEPSGPSPRQRRLSLRQGSEWVANRRSMLSSSPPQPSLSDYHAFSDDAVALQDSTGSMDAGVVVVDSEETPQDSEKTLVVLREKLALLEALLFEQKIAEMNLRRALESRRDSEELSPLTGFKPREEGQEALAVEEPSTEDDEAPLQNHEEDSEDSLATPSGKSPTPPMTQEGQEPGEGEAASLLPPAPPTPSQVRRKSVGPKQKPQLSSHPGTSSQDSFSSLKAESSLFSESGAGSSSHVATEDESTKSRSRKISFAGDADALAKTANGASTSKASNEQIAEEVFVVGDRKSRRRSRSLPSSQAPAVASPLLPPPTAAAVATLSGSTNAGSIADISRAVLIKLRIKEKQLAVLVQAATKACQMLGTATLEGSSTESLLSMVEELSSSMHAEGSNDNSLLLHATIQEVSEEMSACEAMKLLKRCQHVAERSEHLRRVLSRDDIHAASCANMFTMIPADDTSGNLVQEDSVGGGVAVERKFSDSCLGDTTDSLSETQRSLAAAVRRLEHTSHYSPLKRTALTLSLDDSSLDGLLDSVERKLEELQVLREEHGKVLQDLRGMLEHDGGDLRLPVVVSHAHGGEEGATSAQSTPRVYSLGMHDGTSTDEHHDSFATDSLDLSDLANSHKAQTLVLGGNDEEDTSESDIVRRRAASATFTSSPQPRRGPKKKPGVAASSPQGESLLLNKTGVLQISASGSLQMFSSTQREVAPAGSASAPPAVSKAVSPNVGPAPLPIKNSPSVTPPQKGSDLVSVVKRQLATRVGEVQQLRTAIKSGIEALGGAVPAAETAGEALPGSFADGLQDGSNNPVALTHALVSICKETGESIQTVRELVGDTSSGPQAERLRLSELVSSIRMKVVELEEVKEHSKQLAEEVRATMDDTLNSSMSSMSSSMMGAPSKKIIARKSKPRQVSMVGLAPQDLSATIGGGSQSLKKTIFFVHGIPTLMDRPPAPLQQLGEPTAQHGTSPETTKRAAAAAADGEAAPLPPKPANPMDELRTELKGRLHEVKELKHSLRSSLDVLLAALGMSAKDLASIGGSAAAHEGATHDPLQSSRGEQLYQAAIVAGAEISASREAIRQVQALLPPVCAPRCPPVVSTLPPLAISATTAIAASSPPGSAASRESTQYDATNLDVDDAVKEQLPWLHDLVQLLVCEFKRVRNECASLKLDCDNGQKQRDFLMMQYDEEVSKLRSVGEHAESAWASLKAELESGVRSKDNENAELTRLLSRARQWQETFAEQSLDCIAEQHEWIVSTITEKGWMPCIEHLQAYHVQDHRMQQQVTFFESALEWFTNSVHLEGVESSLFTHGADALHNVALQSIRDCSLSQADCAAWEREAATLNNLVGGLRTVSSHLAESHEVSSEYHHEKFNACSEAFTSLTNQLTSELMMSMDRAVELEDKTFALTCSVTEGRIREAELQKQVQLLQDRLEEMTTQHDSTRSTCDAQQAEISRLRTRISDLEVQLGYARDSCSQFELGIQKSKKALADIANEKKMLQGDMELLAQTNADGLARLQNHNTQLQANLDDLSQKNGDLLHENTNLSTRLKVLEGELDTFTTRHSEQASLLQKELDHHIADLAAKEAALATLTTEVDAATKQYETLMNEGTQCTQLLTSSLIELGDNSISFNDDTSLSNACATAVRFLITLHEKASVWEAAKNEAERRAAEATSQLLGLQELWAHVDRRVLCPLHTWRDAQAGRLSSQSSSSSIFGRSSIELIASPPSSFSALPLKPTITPVTANAPSMIDVAGGVVEELTYLHRAHLRLEEELFQCRSILEVCVKQHQTGGGAYRHVPQQQTLDHVSVSDLATTMVALLESSTQQCRALAGEWQAAHAELQSARQRLSLTEGEYHADRSAVAAKVAELRARVQDKRRADDETEQRVLEVEEALEDRTHQVIELNQERHGVSQHIAHIRSLLEQRRKWDDETNLMIRGLHDQWRDGSE